MTNILTLLAVLVSTAVSLFLLNGFVKFKLKNKLSENEHPITISYFKGSLFVTIGLLLSELNTTFQTLTKILPSQLVGSNLVFKEVSFYCIFFAIALLIFVVLFWFATLLFSLLSKGQNIFMEVANNNLQGIILFSAILLAITFAIKTGITPLLDEYIPYPEMPIYR